MTNEATLSPLMRGLVAMYAGSGAIHFIKPEVFAQMVPRELPRHTELVYASGAAELVCAAGLLIPRTRTAAAYASAALLVAVLPGNVEMSRQYIARAQKKPSAKNIASAAGTLARIPAQWPLIRASWKLARGI